MPSVVLLSLNCIRVIARIDVRYIHNGRGHSSPYPRMYLAYVFTYAAAKVLLFLDICKDWLLFGSFLARFGYFC